MKWTGTSFRGPYGILLTLLAIQGAMASAAVTLELFGEFEGKPFYASNAYAVSADGSTVAGSTTYVIDLFYGTFEIQAFLYENGVQTLLGASPAADPFGSTASGISADGSVVAGVSNGAFRWEGGILTDLPGLVGMAHGVSGDGSIVVGNFSEMTPVPQIKAVKWINGVPTELGFISGTQGIAHARAISSDGSTIVGESSSDLGTQAFRLQEGPMAGIGDLEGGLFQSVAYAVSANGDVVVGSGSTDTGMQAFRWSSGEMMVLPDLPSSYSTTEAKGVSGDGSIVVGYSFTDTMQEAVMWPESGNFQPISLNDYLDEKAVDRGDWTLTTAEAISTDGTTIVGQASNSFAVNKAYRLRLDPVTPTWAGYPIAPDGHSVDTTPLLGWIDITHGDWIWSYALGKYIYLPENNVSSSGAWAWFPR